MTHIDWTLNLIPDEERVQLLHKLWYSDVQKWTSDLLLSVYRAAHTAVWGEELDGELFYIKYLFLVIFDSLEYLVFSDILYSVLMNTYAGCCSKYFTVYGIKSNREKLFMSLFPNPYYGGNIFRVM